MDEFRISDEKLNNVWKICIIPLHYTKVKDKQRKERKKLVERKERKIKETNISTSY